LPIKPQHQRAIDKLRDRFIADPRYLALLVGGSVAKGTAREDSDVDCSLVATDEEWLRRQEARDYSFYLKEEVCDYPGGYAEFRIYSLDFLKEVAKRGTETLRSQFFNAIIVFSHRPEIEEIVRRIPIFPEAERE
jgi:predicted nucleotidyltransferase